jgi:hypothetical protein
LYNKAYFASPNRERILVISYLKKKPENKMAPHLNAGSN